MQPALSCPQRDDYVRLIHGELPPSEVEHLSQHLAGCSSCTATVQTLVSEDTLISVLRGTTVDGPTDEKVPADLTRRLLALAAEASGEQGCVSALNLSSLLAPPQSADEIGRLAHYRVLKVLGEGGMGVVFLAEDTRLGRTVALKTMKPEIATNLQHRQRFLREARAAAKVEHDHIVPIYDVGEDNGVPWLAMPFLKGQSLDELLKRWQVLKPAQAVRLGAHVAKGLAAAHAAGLIHRDVKPANIWIEPEGGGRAKLLDFGLARNDRPDGRGEEQLTRPGAVIGTPAYMAPEQAGGEPLDARADLFSLGCVLYRMVTGQLPFQGQGMMGMMRALATQTPPDPHQVNPAVPQPLSALIIRLLAKDRSARPASAATVAKALESLQEKPASTVSMAIPVAPLAPPNPFADMDTTEPVLQPPPSPLAGSRAGHSVPRRRLLVAAAVLFVLVGSLLLGQIVIKLYDEKGRKTAEITVPQGGKAVIEKDGKPIATLPKDEKPQSAKAKFAPKAGEPKPGKPPAFAGDPDRRAAEYVLSIGGTIRINDPERAIAVAALPKEPFRLTFVNLDQNKQVTNAGLAHFQDCKNLMVLYLAGTQVSDAGLAHFQDCKNLTDLSLSGTQVTNAGLARFQHCKNLKVLYLAGTQVSDAGLAHFQDCKNLGILYLGWTRVTDAGLEHLKGLTNLRYLRLDNTRVSDAGLEHLKGLTNLGNLGLASTQVSDAGLVHLKGLTKLTSIFLGDTRVSGAGLVHFKGLTALYLGGQQVSDAGLEYLKGLTKLTFLDLSNTRVSDAGLEHLKGLTNLGNLGLSSTQVSDAGLEHLKGLTNLVTLGLSSTRLSDAGLVHLKGLTNLDSLVLNGTRVSDAGLIHLKELPKLTNLQLRGTRVSDAGLSHLVNLPLKNIDLRFTLVSARGFANLRSAFPDAQIVGEPGASVTEILLTEGGTLVIRTDKGQEDRVVKKITDLPREPFLVRRADCTGIKKPLAEVLTGLCDWRGFEFERLEALDLSGCALDDLGFAWPLESLQELNVSGTKVSNLQPLSGLKRLRKLLLDHTPVSSLGPIAELSSLEELSLVGTPVAGAALQALEKLPNLWKLNFDQSRITGRGLVHLAKLPKLTELSLAGSKISNLLVPEIGALTRLERLSLAGCTVSDDGLKHLTGMKNLKQLDLTGTQATADGVAALQKALPKCKIFIGATAK